MEPTAESMRKLYDRRFGAELRARKDSLWKVLCADFFQKYVAERTPSSISAPATASSSTTFAPCRKFAVDLNEDTPESAASDVTVLLTEADKMTQFEDNTVDVVFTSNLFEHIRSKDELVSILHEVHRVLKPGKQLLVLMPNIRYAFREYWDYYDHHLPLSHHSLSEVLTFTDFDVTEVRSRFLPYTFKTRLPQTDFLLRLYLTAPLCNWSLAGRCSWSPKSSALNAGFFFLRLFASLSDFMTNFSVRESDNPERDQPRRHHRYDDQRVEHQRISGRDCFIDVGKYQHLLDEKFERAESALRQGHRKSEVGGSPLRRGRCTYPSSMWNASPTIM